MRVNQLFFHTFSLFLALLVSAAPQRPDADFLDDLGKVGGFVVLLFFDLPILLTFAIIFKLLQSASISLPVDIPSDFLPTAIPSNIITKLPSNLPSNLSPNVPQSSRRLTSTGTLTSTTSSHTSNPFSQFPKFNIPPELLTQVESVMYNHATNTAQHRSSLAPSLSNVQVTRVTQTRSSLAWSLSPTRSGEPIGLSSILPSPKSLDDFTNTDENENDNDDLVPPSNNQNLKKIHPLSQGQLRAMQLERERELKEIGKELKGNPVKPKKTYFDEIKDVEDKGVANSAIRNALAAEAVGDATLNTASTDTPTSSLPSGTIYALVAAGVVCVLVAIGAAISYKFIHNRRKKQANKTHLAEISNKVYNSKNSNSRILLDNALSSNPAEKTELLGGRVSTDSQQQRLSKGRGSVDSTTRESSESLGGPIDIEAGQNPRSAKKGSRVYLPE
ncbi:hypothetical protein HK096_006732 [Nowakowskiella sp. JEL0078]|nr:hypothetical protein HK096_006732 [Nowakowskiella sp. JEL0078]